MQFKFQKYCEPPLVLSSLYVYGLTLCLLSWRGFQNSRKSFFFFCSYCHLWSQRITQTQQSNLVTRSFSFWCSCWFFDVRKKQFNEHRNRFYKLYHRVMTWCDTLWCHDFQTGGWGSLEGCQLVPGGLNKLEGILGKMQNKWNNCKKYFSKIRIKYRPNF